MIKNVLIYLTLILSCFCSDFHAEELPIFHEYDEKGQIIRQYDRDGLFDYHIYREDRSLTIVNQVTNEQIIQKFDQQGRLIQEIFPENQKIKVTYENKQLSTLTLPDDSAIVYEYHDQQLKQVTRINPCGERLYTHRYVQFDKYQREEELIGNLGKVKHRFDPKKMTIELDSPRKQIRYDLNTQNQLQAKKTPSCQQVFAYDQNGYLLKDNQGYDPLGNPLSDQIDAQGRCITHNGWQCTYDQKGRLIAKSNQTKTFQYHYDALNRLIKVESDQKTIEYTYDFFNRRLSKTVYANQKVTKENFLYLGSHEIAVYDRKNNIKHLRVPGSSFHEQITIAIAFESHGKVWAPIYGLNCELEQIIDIHTHEVIDLTDSCPFGRHLSKTTTDLPWIFAAKHYDRESGLVYFGHRYYDPKLLRWITPDPIGPKDSENLYLYCLNNPFLYVDPDGRAVVIAIPIVIGGALPTLGAIAAASAVITAGYCTSKAIERANQKEREKDRKKNTQIEEPPYNGEKLGENPSKPPAEGFEWRGYGDPASGQGSWYNPEKNESLHPDLDHPPPKSPHWDYVGPNNERARLNTDGTWEWK